MPASARVPLSPARPLLGNAPPMRWPTAAAGRYYLKLVGIVRSIAAIIERELVPAIPSFIALQGVRLDAPPPKGDDEFTERARRQVADVVTRADVETMVSEAFAQASRFNRRELANQSTAQLGVDVFQNDPPMAAHQRAFIRRNLRLVKDAADAQLDRAAALIYQGAAAGLRHEQIAQQISDATGISIRRANLIAVNEVGNVNAELNRLRQEEVGVEEYTWSSSGDERVRLLHRHLNATKHRWKRPPVSGPNGERQHPGYPIRCRCNAIPDMQGALDRLMGVTTKPKKAPSVRGTPAVLDGAKLTPAARRELAAVKPYADAAKDFGAAMKEALGNNRLKPRAMRLAVRRAVKTQFPTVVSRDVAHERTQAHSLAFERLPSRVAGYHHSATGGVRISSGMRRNVSTAADALSVGGDAVGRLTDAQQFSVHALIHEEIHGTSPTTHATYSRSGATVEELTTELMARAVGRSLGFTGYPVLPPAVGDHRAAYSKAIDATLTIAEAIASWSREESHSRAVDAAATMRGRRKTGPITSPRDYVIAFARAMGMSEADAIVFYEVMEKTPESLVKLDAALTAQESLAECTPGDADAARRTLRLFLVEQREVPAHVAHYLAQQNPQVDLLDELPRIYEAEGLRMPEPDEHWDHVDLSTVAL